MFWLFLSITDITEIFFPSQNNGIFLSKFFWPNVIKNCSSDRKKKLKYEAEGREFAKFTVIWEESIELPFKGKNYLWHSFDLTTLRLPCSETIFPSCVRMHFVWKFRIFSSLKTCEVQSSMKKQIICIFIYQIIILCKKPKSNWNLNKIIIMDVLM